MIQKRMKYVFFFFFQAEDGIRDWSVTGVQTCALPIYREVVQEIAEEQYELQKDRLVDSEREGGPVHG